MASIHPSSIISSQALIGRDVEIGPFCIIENDTTIGDGCRIASHVVLKQRTELGQNNLVDKGAVLGGRPQHLGAGEKTGSVLIGSGNQIREFATIHCGLGEGDQTIVGDNNMLMVGAHLGHDCRVGNHTIIANNVMLGGHVLVEDRVYLGGGAAAQQFCRIGRNAMVGGYSRVMKDVPPFVTLDGGTSQVVGLNHVGLSRNGFTPEQMEQLKAAYRIIFRSGMKWDDILATLKREFQSGPVVEFHSFLSQSKCGILRERRTPPAATLKFNSSSPDEISPRIRKAG